MPNTQKNFNFTLTGEVNANDESLWTLPDSGKVNSSKVDDAKITEIISARTGISQENIGCEIDKYRVMLRIERIPLKNSQQVIESLLAIKQFQVSVYELVNQDEIGNW